MKVSLMPVHPLRKLTALLPIRPLILLGFLLAASPLVMAAEGGGRDEPVTLNFVNADIESTMKALSLITQRNFVLDPRVKGTINIVSSQAVPRAAVYPMVLSALRVQGYAAVETRGLTKIVPESDAKLHGGPTVGQATNLSGDQLVTQVYPLKYESAQQMLQVLRPLISTNNNISVYPNANVLVITDYADNLKRLDRIIASIDQPADTRVQSLILKYASAVELAQMVQKLLPDLVQTVGNGAAVTSNNDGPKKAVILPDVRSNSLLVRADQAAQMAQIRRLVEMLDVPADGGGNIHVVPLKNAEATKLAQTLRSLLSGQDSSAAGSSTGSTNVSTGGSGSNNAQVLVSASASKESSGGMIQADAATNALIITAPDAVYNSLRSVIDKLDVRRAQVFVEALIVELTTSKGAELGFQFQDYSGLSKNNTQVVGGTNFKNGLDGSSNSILDLAQNPLSLGGGLNLGVIRGSITYQGKTFMNLGVLAHALDKDQQAHILSTPTLLTLDNEEAKIVIGRNVPFVTGSYTQTGSSVTSPFQTVERKDVGLMLKVKPQISESGSVKLQINQEISKVDRTNSSSNGLETTKRSIDSTVLIDNGQIVVLGGLIEDDVSQSVDKVPVLGDLPVIGGLFSNEARARTRTNLMVFLRPVILRDSLSSHDLSEERYGQIRDLLKAADVPQGVVLPALPAPTLPAMPARPAPAPVKTPAPSKAASAL